MSSTVIENLEKLLAGPRDGALLRYSLGNEWLKAGDGHRAAAHLEEAVARDPNFSAAWKLLGKARQEGGDLPGALAAYRQGVAVATVRKDIQAAKEMTVFARRLEKQLAQASTPTT